MNDKENSVNFVEGLSFFKGAPVSKLWLLLFIILTILRVYWNSTVEWAYIIGLSDFWKNISTIDIILLLLSVDDFSTVVGQIGLIHAGRLIERRFGSRKFFTFLLFMCLICFPLFIYTLQYYTSYYHYNKKKIYIKTLSEIFFGGIFVQLIQEIPVIPYVRIFGLPLSVHHLPIIFMIQIIMSSKFSFISIIIGGVISYIYSSNIIQKSLVKLVNISLFNNLENSRSIFLIYLYKILNLFFNKFLEPSDEKLPIACTVEKQREELLDMYENEIIQQQLRHFYNNNPRNTNNPDGQLHYLNRMLRRENIQNDEEIVIPEPPENAIETLRDMGFTNEEEVRETLRRFRNDIAQAANYLLNR
ncbi:Ubiquitin-associated domain/translation elongation factor EF-Ts, N-terminal and UBA-like domain and Ubiquitin-associated/translation elongation factor EF1B, N-terminal, eukaryote domain-containing protein [Strongyloides ratti]|uniref:UBA domain-containing protein n=1 Tax=Strongyloides ratti TaxID=34506 RepID=A0A090L2X3_STRRB|nr:Ubiquitin-associated domain/translation elongation factor EF-Ts, N-terminal and UBA-like domain and Ubiquitin-associated/translation elongation factor EF1B, N-terminal, eukaryote domain-containing protein [Strongyloides ratti]CEF61814.1 Ubiquitin-associated domain/translation elongation factor EF-Ts, N-terminal and UBA-like domain and Ubiquitin-associated/translation elongation factor EF1B, N-terminal, eukaryote domain-containing protein [Strongyloides ratti]